MLENKIHNSIAAFQYSIIPSRAASGIHGTAYLLSYGVPENQVFNFRLS
jgi:hypothetical protein